jgi:hypothetical protein
MLNNDIIRNNTSDKEYDVSTVNKAFCKAPQTEGVELG